MKIISFFIFMAISLIGFGQQIDTLKEKTIIYIEESNNLDKESNKFNVDSIFDIYQCDEKPSFPGGDFALIMFIAQNARYPEMAKNDKVQGTVYVRFVITKSGEIDHVNVLKPFDPSLDNEAIRVIKMLPKWNPAVKNGNLVNSWFIVPIKFSQP